MATPTLKKPPMKETVGAQYICFDASQTAGEYTGTFESEVEKTMTVKSVEVSEEYETQDVYASGEVYAVEGDMTSAEISVETIAFVAGTLAKMRGDTVSAAGLIGSGGKRSRPYFAYGKTVKYRGGGIKYQWYPKCTLVENDDRSETKTNSFNEMADSVTIRALPFNAAGDISKAVDSRIEMPEGLTEDAFFAQPILSDEDLATAIAAAVAEAAAAAEVNGNGGGDGAEEPQDGQE